MGLAGSHVIPRALEIAYVVVDLKNGQLTVHIADNGNPTTGNLERPTVPAVVGQLAFPGAVVVLTIVASIGD